MEKVKNTIQPIPYEKIGIEAAFYRWGIEQVENNEHGEPQWEYYEIMVFATVTADKITRAVIDLLWGNGLEQKYLNDYYAAVEGLLPESAKDNYINFLAQRKTIKEEIDNVCELNGIPKNR